MRKNFDPQLELGATAIESIRLNPRSRDDIPKLLYGLQFIYSNPSIRDQIFMVLEDGIGQDIDFNNGRPGMDLWVLLVLGTLRLGANCDYDRLHELANEHQTLRAMLGHGNMSEQAYGLQTLKDNVRLLTDEMLEKINTLVVEAGHQLVKKKEGENTLDVRCDSFVVETDVEFPTDIGLLHDAVRKTIVLTSALCADFGIKGWRQSRKNARKLKACWRAAQQSNRSRSSDAEQKKLSAYTAYLVVANTYLERSLLSLSDIEVVGKSLTIEQWTRLHDKIADIRDYQAHALRQINQIERRVLREEKIPSSEKVYSIFEPHTEWISKGKAGVPVEFGIKVCIIEDQHQFILHHRVMEKEQDVHVAVEMIEACKKKFPTLSSCSFDRGFHSPENQTQLAELLDEVVLPKKGKIKEADKALTQTESYRSKKKQHSAVESAINGLEQTGLDRCPDHGLVGFRRYVALSVLARNLQRVGSLVKMHDQKRQTANQVIPEKIPIAA
jgi:hypothetical protein